MGTDQDQTKSTHYTGFKVSAPSRSLRFSGLLTIPKPRTKRHGEVAFSYYAPSLWNSLPENLRGGAVTVEIFKRDLKRPLLFLFQFEL